MDIESEAEPVIVFVPVPVAVLYVRVEHLPRPGEVFVFVTNFNGFKSNLRFVCKLL